MASYQPGSDVTIQATFRDQNKALVTPSSVTATVTDPSGAAVIVAVPTAVSTGVYQSTVFETDTLPLGDYTVRFVGIVNGQDSVIEYNFTVSNLTATPDPLARAAMISYCGWDPTTPITETVSLSGNGTSLLTLPSLYVTAVSAVVVTNLDGSTYTAVLTPGVGQDVGWKQNGELWWIGRGYSGFGSGSWDTAGSIYWPVGQQNIAVTYTGGYTDLVPDLEAAIASLSNRMPQVQSGRTSARLGSAAFTYAAPVAAGGLLLVEQMVLDRYRLPRVA